MVLIMSAIVISEFSANRFLYERVRFVVEKRKQKQLVIHLIEDEYFGAS